MIFLLFGQLFAGPFGRSIGLGVLLSLAAPFSCPRQQQEQPPSPPPPPSAEKAPGPDKNSLSEKKEKKVWTNENLDEAKGQVSIVGGGGKSSGASKNRGKPDGAYIQNVRKQLQKLQAQLVEIDRQSAALKRFSEGEGDGQADRELHKGYNSQPIDQQMRALETKRKDTQAKIDALLDETRKRGVQPGDLR